MLNTNIPDIRRSTFLIRHELTQFDKQLFFLSLLVDSFWHLDFPTGKLSFGSKYRWQTQLLGTESEVSGTWLWAWANTASNIPAHLLTASLALKAYGEQHNIPELTTPQPPLDQIDPHALALLTSGICEASAYFRCPYNGGALYVLITDDNFPKCPDPPLQRIATVFPQAIAALDLPDHEQALCGYLDHYGLSHEHADGRIVVPGAGGEPVLSAAFDAHKRLTRLDVTLTALAPPHVSDVLAPPPEPSWDDEQLRRIVGG